MCVCVCVCVCVCGVCVCVCPSLLLNWISIIKLRHTLRFLMINSWNCVFYIKLDHTLGIRIITVTQSCTWQPPRGVLDNDYTSLTETFGASAEIILATCVEKNND